MLFAHSATRCRRQLSSEAFVFTVFQSAVSEKLRSHIADEHHHGHGVNWRFDEPVTPIEALGVRILGVDQHQPNPNSPGYLDCLEHEVPEESSAETAPPPVRRSRMLSGAGCA